MSLGLSASRLVSCMLLLLLLLLLVHML